MQFIVNGPDIPDMLLQSHEEGRVVFFCGAGISYPAGLLDFKGLVDQIYSFNGTTKLLDEHKAFENEKYDATLDLLERRLPGGRFAVRKTLLKALKPNFKRRGAIDTHIALLQLARNRKGTLRIVTTNFDHVFEQAAKRKKIQINSYQAPTLPIPKNSRWDGLVYLHGFLPENDNEIALNQLVLTSGDFGLAYLTERWASRFVSELFRNYIVCFVGYSISDPVLRYMMDALAADRRLGETAPQAYAFGDYKEEQELSKKSDWEAKGVTPILYKSTSGKNKHSALHDTLRIWAEIYRDGILGKERIVVDYAKTRPTDSTQQDDFVGRMLWALSDKSGLPAKRFADINPAPSLEWLYAFSEDRYRHSDLKRFGVFPKSEEDKNISYSLIRRPTPYKLAPLMSLFSSGETESQWDDVMIHLGRWLVRHLNDSELIIRIAQGGSKIHSQLARLIENRLNQINQFEKDDNKTQLEELRATDPQGIPSQSMRILWRLMLTGMVRMHRNNLDFYYWKKRVNLDGLTASLRLELKKILAPNVILNKPFPWREEDDESTSPDRLNKYVDWELALASDHVYSSISHLEEDDPLLKNLPFLREDFQQLLRDALDLLGELGEADEKRDRSHWDLPSISTHWQNKGFRDWVALIVLLRDSWLAIRNVDPGKASEIAKEWFSLPYACFKRLAFFAASQDNCIPSEIWVEWLLADKTWWLWSWDTRREIMRLLVLQGSHLSSDGKLKLEATILAGPPRDEHHDDVDPERWKNFFDHSVWLRLAKLQSSGIELGKEATQILNKLSTEYPNWKLASNERDEFSHWMSGTGDPDYEAMRDIDFAPRKRRELVEWLKKPLPSRRPFYEDTWRETCRKHLYNCAFALLDIAKDGIWPAERWRDALYVWSEKKQIIRSWKLLKLFIPNMSGIFLQEISDSISWWLEAVSSSIEKDDITFLEICDRVLDLTFKDESNNNHPITESINHPVGRITQALINFWFKHELNDNDKLSDDVQPFFTKLCDIREPKFKYGRVILASQLVALFRVDSPWTKTHLLPLFDWEKSLIEAKAVWQGFLWSPRLYWPLLVVIKKQFIDTTCHYEQLDEHGPQFATLLTYAALEPVDQYKPKEFQVAFNNLPQEGLNESAQTLVQALESVGEQREDYWENRIKPFWENIWPKSQDLISDRIVESFVRLSIAARNEFPSAISIFKDWLSPIDSTDYSIHLLYESGLIQRFPNESLLLLDKIIGNNSWAPSDLRKCLEIIAQKSPTSVEDNRYQRLDTYAKQHNQ